MKDRVATTVKIENTLYDDFKVFGVRHKISLQKLVERAVFRYVTEENFRNEINNFNLPVTYTSVNSPVLRATCPSGDSEKSSQFANFPITPEGIPLLPFGDSEKSSQVVNFPITSEGIPLLPLSQSVST
jgi:hypothetical protein